MQTSRLTFNLASKGVKTIINRQICKRYFSDFNYSTKCKAAAKCCRMKPTALLILAPGAEELESITVVDVLRRGGVQVTIGGLCGPDLVKCRCDTLICPDKSLQEAIQAGPYNAIILPGGLVGAKMLSESCEVGKLLKKQERLGELICAICAGPTALKAHNIGKGKCITSFPSVAPQMKEGNVYQYKDNCPVVVDGKLITSRGPATALIFAYTILELLQGREVTKEVSTAMLYEY